MTDRPVPRPYVFALLFIAGVAILTLLTWFGVGPFGSVEVFILSNIVGFFTLLVLGVLGGAFVGLLVAHRIFSQNEFSPFERAVVQSLDEIKRDLETVSARQEEMKARLDRVEENARPPVKRE